MRNPGLAFMDQGKASTSTAKVAELERLVGRLYAENAFIKKSFEGLKNLVAEYLQER